jgi:hypothetical protein
MDAGVLSPGLLSPGGGPAPTLKPHNRRRQSNKIFDDPAVIRGYESVQLLEIDVLPRGGISLETKAVGRIQVGFSFVFRQLCHIPPHLFSSPSLVWHPSRDD